MSRPVGEIRQALRVAAVALAERQGGCTWRDAAQVACVGFSVARQTMRDMEVSGELVRVETRRTHGMGRPMVVYAPRRSSANWVMGGPSLASVLGGWVRGRG